MNALAEDFELKDSLYLRYSAFCIKIFPGAYSTCGGTAVLQSKMAQTSSCHDRPLISPTPHVVPIIVIIQQSVLAISEMDLDIWIKNVSVEWKHSCCVPELHFMDTNENNGKMHFLFVLYDKKTIR